jgi:hypothetical protein
MFLKQLREYKNTAFLLGVNAEKGSLIRMNGAIHS